MSRTAMVTGASGGLGSAVAAELARRGYRLALHFNTGRNRVERVVSGLQVETMLFRADLLDRASLEAMFREVEAWSGGIDLVVHCAGITSEALFVRVREEEFDRVVRVNLDGAFHVIRLAAALMGPRRSGHIVLVSSRAGLKGPEGLAAYAASKSGLIGLGLTAAREMASVGIRVNCVLPGFLLSEMGRRASDGARARAREEHLMNRLGDVNDVAGFVGWLAGSEGVTGQVFNVDGRPL